MGTAYFTFWGTRKKSFQIIQRPDVLFVSVCWHCWEATELNGWRSSSRTSYSALLLTAAGRCKKWSSLIHSQESSLIHSQKSSLSHFPLEATSVLLEATSVLLKATSVLLEATSVLLKATSVLLEATSVLLQATSVLLEVYCVLQNFKENTL